MASSDFEAQLIAAETETSAKIRGWARVSTHSLLFYPDFTPAGANFCKEKVQRLTRVFEEEGCHRQNISYCISGNIDESDLRAALLLSGVGMDDLQRRDDPPRVFLPSGSFVRCAYGRSRVNALQETESVDHWWTIALHTDLSTHAFEILSGFDHNSGRHSDGHIFSEICRLRSLDSAREKQWWSRLSKSKRDILKRFMKHPHLGPVYSNVLLSIPGMRDKFQIGSLPEMISARSYEPIVSYMSLILSTWTTIVGSESLLKCVDAVTVEELQLRAPGVSQLDDQHITAAIRGGRVFRGLTNEAEREKIVARMRTIDYIIPSIHTLQQDFKYHRQCNGVIKELLRDESTAMRTVEQSAYRVFVGQGSVASRELFRGRYKLLTLYVMRHLVELSEQNPLLEESEAKQEPRSRDPWAWYELACEAKRLGFSFKTVTQILSQDPDKQAAQQLLLRARRPERFEFDPAIFDSLILQVTDALSHARKRPINHREPRLTLAHPGEPIARRCGRQFSESYLKDRDFLTENYFTRKVGRNIDISSLFVRRSVFHAFWGDSHQPSDSVLSSSMDITLDDPVTSQGQEQPSQSTGPSKETNGGSIHVEAPVTQQVQIRGHQNLESFSPRLNTDLQMIDDGVVDRILPAQNHSKIALYCMVNNLWQKVEDCDKHSIRERVQRIKSELEAHGQSLFLFNAYGRGITLEDCEREDQVGIGPEGSPAIEEL